MTQFFWLHMILYDYFSSVFCIVTKKVLLFKYRKCVSYLKNRYHYAKVVENARTNFSVSPYCTLLFSTKENFKFLEVALSAVLCNDAVGCIMNMWGYQHWIPHWKFACFLKTVSFFPCFLKTSVFFINLEHLSHPSLVLLFILWKGKCWLKVRRELFVKLIQWC